MRILIYVEPHPIRGTRTHFVDVAARFIPLLRRRDLADVRMFVNQATAALIGPKLDDISRASLITMSDEEERALRRFDGPWSRPAIETWRDLLAGGPTADIYCAMLERVARLFPFNAIVHWGENGAVARFAAERSIARVAMELGCTRKPFCETVVMDPFGTNGSAVVPKLDADDLCAIVDSNDMPASEALLAFSENLDTLPYEQRFSRASFELPTRRGATRGPVAFFPLQLYDDANLLLFSPYSSLGEAAADIVPRLVAAGYTVIVKPHPAARHRPNGMLENTIARERLERWSEKVIWLDDAQAANARIIEISDLVVTVNSSVGFEALYFDKPVVVMGSAIYKPQGVFPDLSEAINEQYDRDAYRRRIGWLRRFMLGGYLVPDDGQLKETELIHRILTLTELKARCGDDARTLARDYWRSYSPAQTRRALTIAFAGRCPPGQSDIRPADPPAGASATGDRAFLDAALSSWWARSPQVANPEAELAKAWASASGREAFLRSIDLVDEVFYRRTYPDLATAGGDLVAHYAAYGWREKRRPRAAISQDSARDILGALRAAAERQATLMSSVADVRAAIEASAADGPAEFRAWLEAVWSDRTRRVDAIRLSDVVDAEFYRATYADVAAARVDPVKHFSLNGLFEGRRASARAPALSSGALREELARAGDRLFAECARLRGEDPLGEEEASRLRRDLESLRRTLEPGRGRIAVVAHLYYRDVASEILDALDVMPEAFDLVVSLPQWGARTIREMVRERHPDAFCFTAPNRGRDIGPFLEVMRALEDLDYDAVLKLQTKRGYFLAGRMKPELGALWRREALGALLPDRAGVARILAEMRTNDRLTMIGPSPFWLPLRKYPYHDGGRLARLALGRNVDVLAGGFFAGTMFWLRPSCIRPLLAKPLALGLDCFPREDGQSDATIAHAVERLFGQCAAAGGEIAMAQPKGAGASQVTAATFPKQTIHEHLEALLDGADSAAPNEGALLWGAR